MIAQTKASGLVQKIQALAGIEGLNLVLSAFGGCWAKVVECRVRCCDQLLAILSNQSHGLSTTYSYILQHTAYHLSTC